MEIFSKIVRLQSNPFLVILPVLQKCPFYRDSTVAIFSDVLTRCYGRRNDVCVSRDHL